MGLVAFADGSAEINDSTFSESTLHSDLAFCSVIACLDTSMAVAQRVLPKVIGSLALGRFEAPSPVRPTLEKPNKHLKNLKRIKMNTFNCGLQPSTASEQQRAAWS